MAIKPGAEQKRHASGTPVHFVLHRISRHTLKPHQAKAEPVGFYLPRDVPHNLNMQDARKEIYRRPFRG
jgi:hypothetical protein